MSPQQTTSGSLLQGGATLTDLQPASTAQQMQPAGPTGISTSTTTTPSTLSAPVVDQSIVQANNLKSNIKNLIGNALGVYDTLYSNLGAAAASQKKQLEQQFGQQESQMQQQFSQELPRIGTAYAGRGAYDSSWRTNAENAARDQMLNQLQSLGMERTAQMSSLGKSVMEQEAAFKAGQDALNRNLAGLNDITDINQLNTLQTDIQKRISDLQQAKAGLQSQEAFTQKFQQIGGPSDRSSQVKAIVDNILGGAAAPELKQSVATGFIQSSGLSPAEQDTLIQYLNSTIDRLATPTTSTTPTA